MFKIAICDDNKLYGKEIEKCLVNHLPNSVNINIFLFESGEELISWYKNNNANLVFLDIEMPVIDGIETAKQIRKIDNDIDIVFLTNYKDYALKGYEVSAYRYLLKESSIDKLESKIQNLMQNYFIEVATIEIKKQNEIFLIALKDIIYLEAQNKKIILSTISSEHEFYGKISDMEKKLLVYDFFIKPHRSFLVNLFYINKIDNNNIVLKNDISIPISRNHKNNIPQKYTEFKIKGLER